MSKTPLFLQGLGVLAAIGGVYFAGKKPVGDWWKKRTVKKMVNSPRVIGNLPFGGVNFKRDESSDLEDFFDEGQKDMIVICGKPGTGKSVTVQQELEMCACPGVYFNLRDANGIQKGLGLSRNVDHNECLGILGDVIEKEKMFDFVFIIDAFCKKGEISEKSEKVIGTAYGFFERGYGKVLFISSNPEDDSILRNSFSGMTARLNGPYEIPSLSKESIVDGLKKGLPHLSDEVILQSWEDCGTCLSDLQTCLSSLIRSNKEDMMEKYRRRLDKIVKTRCQKLISSAKRINKKVCLDVCRRLVENGEWVRVGSREEEAIIELGRENFVHTKEQADVLLASYKKKIDLKSMHRWISGEHERESDDL